MCKFLVTGVSGLVGYRLARNLLEQNIPLVGLDRNENKFSADLQQFPGFSFRAADVCSLPALRDAIPPSVEIIYHLAGQPAVWFANTHPAEDFTVNVSGTVNLLELMRERGYGKIIYASTGDVYGEASPAVEDVAPRPLNFYGLSKLSAENYIRLYSRKFGLSHCILRFALIYGPLQKRNIVFDVMQSLATRQINVFTSLESLYDFIFIEDVLQALITAHRQQWENTTVNISSNQGISVGQVVETILGLAGLKNKITVNIKENGITHKVYPNARALGLGWQPQYDFDHGIQKVWQWWMTEHEAAKG